MVIGMSNKHVFDAAALSGRDKNHIAHSTISKAFFYIYLEHTSCSSSLYRCAVVLKLLARGPRLFY